MSDILGKGQHGEVGEDEDAAEISDEYRYRAGIGSRFESLRVED
jgi:hypothetical protein